MSAAAPTHPSYLAAAAFGTVLGINGLAQAWRLAAPLWGLPAAIGQALTVLAVVVWATLLLLYALQAVRRGDATRAEFMHPVAGATPALVGISTLLVATTLRADAPLAGAWIGAAGLAWHLGFALWHGGGVWRGGREATHFIPTLYLPSVGGNLTSAGMLGAYGHADWGFLFLGAGVFAWLALESMMLQQLWRSAPSASARPATGIQFAPAVVAAVAWLLVDPAAPQGAVLMLWGWAVFQMLIGLRVLRWLIAEPWSTSYWSYTFGIASSAVVGCKLALAGVPAARQLGVATFLFANIVILVLMAGSARDLLRMLGSVRAPRVT
jgi:tellurite resistance protein